MVHFTDTLWGERASKFKIKPTVMGTWPSQAQVVLPSGVIIWEHFVSGMAVMHFRRVLLFLCPQSANRLVWCTCPGKPTVVDTLPTQYGTVSCILPHEAMLLFFGAY